MAEFVLAVVALGVSCVALAVSVATLLAVLRDGE
jgi:hypothetical protein